MQLRVASTKLQEKRLILSRHKYTWSLLGLFVGCLFFFFMADSTHGTTAFTSVRYFSPYRFKNDCPSGKPKVVNVEAQSKINFVCPNVATLMDSTLGEVTKTNKYENLWLYTTVLPSTVVMLPRIQSIPSSCAAKTPHHFSSALSYSNGIQLKILLLLRKENPISSSVSVDVTKIIVLKVKP